MWLKKIDGVHILNIMKKCLIWFTIQSFSILAVDENNRTDCRELCHCLLPVIYLGQICMIEAASNTPNMRPAWHQ